MTIIIVITMMVMTIKNRSMSWCGRRITVKLNALQFPAIDLGVIHSCVACLNQVDLSKLIPLQVKRPA